MRTNNKILVGLGISLIAIAVLFTSIGTAVSEPVNISFNVTAEDKNEISIEIVDTNFGSIKQTEDNTLSPSFIANNTGLTNANLSATFTTYLLGQYGLISTDSVDLIPAINLELGLPGSLSPLDNVGNYVFIGGAPKETATNFNAKMTIPNNQATKQYTGIVDILISFA